MTELTTVAIGVEVPSIPEGLRAASFVFLNILPWASLKLHHLALSCVDIFFPESRIQNTVS